MLLKAVYHLPLRATQGSVQSVLKLIGLALPTSHYGTPYRRQLQSGLELPAVRLKRGEALHLVVDSTGCGRVSAGQREGEWKVCTHSKSKRRT